jgi:3D (Asp-Asp-Asp) domain-containing protein
LQICNPNSICNLRSAIYNSPVLLAGSLFRKVLVTAVAAIVFAALYEATILDSRFAASDAGNDGLPAPGSRISFTATAYCKGFVTTAGVAVQSGVAAADPALLPIGSIVELDAAAGRYDGIYSVLDTGPAVQGREIDVYMWSCNEALRFGRQPVRLNVLRLGWNPRAVTPGLLERLFKRPAPSTQLPSRPLPLSTTP